MTSVGALAAEVNDEQPPVGEPEELSADLTSDDVPRLDDIHCGAV